MNILKNPLLAVFAISALSFVSSLSAQVATPANTQPRSYEEIVDKGRALAELIQTKAYTPIKNLRDQKAIRAFIAENGCREYKYHAYVLAYHGDNFLYLIASKRDMLVYSKHFKAPFNGRNIDTASFVANLPICSDAGSPALLSEPVIVNSQQSQLNELHIMQSALHGLRLEVRAGNGNYSVDASREEVVTIPTQLDALTIEPSAGEKK